MIKLKLAISVIGLSLLTACQYGAEEDAQFLHESGNTINVQDRTDLYNEDGHPNGKDTNSANFGYVRHQKSGIPQDVAYTPTPGVNREQTANTISSLIVQLPNIQDVATLVTDEEVLVAYRTNSENRNDAADQVKKTALSVVPRYYHVYVSDDANMIQQIEAYSPLDSNSRDIDQILNKTIKQMLKSPQGKPLNTGENPNGEGYGETNEELDDDTKDQYEKTRYNNDNNK
ncbi:YhcN/YlaJ family sporulation lipoprotein [Bacillus sp. SA1-12]|uniref:YhcN/YlaJ family sporulation lipoprotein n=1 Tax=Bacillus sp. SA1-12 TaxID=1455638 RepID=UPI00069788F2|nr:YhcN/YlaJ family sporulation lipoprotein [Bacillus sp. SA1-12]